MNQPEAPSNDTKRDMIEREIIELEAYLEGLPEELKNIDGAKDPFGSYRDLLKELEQKKGEMDSPEAS